MAQAIERFRAEGAWRVLPKVWLSVLNGCDDMESNLLLASAVLAFSAPWHREVLGLPLAALGAFLPNQARLVGLYFILPQRLEWFEATHGYIVPTTIILAGSLLFIGWLQ
jgi:exosortase/archaeosortase family protein